MTTVRYDPASAGTSPSVRSALLRRDRPTAVAAACALALSVAVLALLAAVVLLLGRPVAVFTDDPAYTTGQPWYLGAMSALGVVGWAVAGTAAGATALVLARDGARTGLVRLLWGGAALSAWFLLDDQFLLHDDVLPRAVGVSETLVYAVYGLALLAWLWLCRRTLLRSPGLPLLVAALAVFGVTNVLDLAHVGGAALDDGGKFVGIAFWAAYFSTAAPLAAARDTASRAAGRRTRSRPSRR